MKGVNGKKPVFVSAGAGFTACERVGDVLATKITVRDVLQRINRKGVPTKQEVDAIENLRALIMDGHTEVTIFHIGFRIFRSNDHLREKATTVFRCARESDTIYKVAAENGKGWECPLLFCLPKSILGMTWSHPRPPVLGEQSKMGMMTASVPRGKKAENQENMHSWPTAGRRAQSA